MFAHGPRVPLRSASVSYEELVEPVLPLDFQRRPRLLHPAPSQSPWKDGYEYVLPVANLANAT